MSVERLRQQAWVFFYCSHSYPLMIENKCLFLGESDAEIMPCLHKRD